jgi:radical SAM superfamily enzyme YgiQ (UPF0313 family)
MTYKALERELENNYDVVGVSITTMTSSSGYDIVRIVKKMSPKTIVVIGGSHTMALGKEIFDECKEIDFIVFGEGEITIKELMKTIEEKGDLHKVKGIGFKEKGKIVITETREMIENLDEIPLPAYHLFDVKRYVPIAGMFKKLPFANMVSSRGCPYDCLFCNKQVWGYKLRMRSPKSIIEEIKYLVKTYDIRELAFFDDTFTIDRDRTIEICRLIKEQAPGLIWKCSTRVNVVDLELLKIMKDSGCYSIGYGIESGNQDILNRVNKQITLEQSRSAIKWTKQVGIETRCYFMLNLPGDTIETTEQTLKFSKELDPDFVGFEITHPYPNTKLWKEIENNPTKYKIVKEKWRDWSAQTGNEIIFTQDGLPVEYIKKAYVRAIRGFYLRPTKILKLLKNALTDYNLFKAYLMAFRNVIRAKVPN